MSLRTLLIDNYDSYTYNLFQLIAEVNGVAPDVIYNNQLTWAELSKRLSAANYDNIVISPGPGTPDCPADIGVCEPLLQANLQLPILGVCMGMQALAVANGAKVCHAPEPIHGRLSQIQHTNHRLFQGIPSGIGSGYAVVRYHSLAVDEQSLPAHLQPIAWTCGKHQPLRATAPQEGIRASPAQAQHGAADRVLQGIAHASLPHYGVQFHPESIGTAFGRQLLQNFHDLTADWHGYQTHHLAASPISGSDRAASLSASRQQPSGQEKLALRWQKLEGQLQQVGGATALFMHLYGHRGAQDTFWLDSSAHDRGRFSYLGGRGGPLWQRISYKLPPPTSHKAHHAYQAQPADHPSACPQHMQWTQREQTQQDRAHSDAHGQQSTSPAEINNPGAQEHDLDILSDSSTSSPMDQADAGQCCDNQAGILTIEDVDMRITQQQHSIWDYLRAQLHVHKMQTDSETAQQLPFDFWGGFVGYLGYELKAECGGDRAHQASTPDAAMFLADRLIALDHQHDDIYLLAVIQPDSTDSQAAAHHWLHTIQVTIEGMLGQAPVPGPALGSGFALGPGPPLDPSELPLEGRISSGNRILTGAASTSSLAGSSQTHQHMDATSSDAAMSDDDWSHRDERGSFASLDSLLSEAHMDSPRQQHSCDRNSTSQSRHMDPCQEEEARAGTAASEQRQAKLRSAVNGQKQQEGARLCAEASAQCQAAEARHSAEASGQCQGAEARLGSVPSEQCQEAKATLGAAPSHSILHQRPVPFKLARSRQQYLQDVAACQQALYNGDSYEICLTTALVRPQPVDALRLYQTLRKVNPAPYAAWLSFGADELQICCSSPERFIKGGRGGLLEARPIKGTAPRAAEEEADKAAAVALASSEKDQAENLMIVDLLRNDLGRVCQVGSVHVPGLMEVESYATVHQLVSTIRGQRRLDISLIDAIKAAFPGGSMTGAPKVRSMQILDALEKEARGVYSGSVGFISFNDTCDLNIVIRTAVVHGGTTRIGAGGAIVVQSDIEEEYEEMRLKAMALLKAVSISEGQNPQDAIASVDVGDG